MTELNILQKLVEQYPQLPALLANTTVSKVIQQIKNKAIDPIFDRDQTAQEIRSWPKPVQKATEWVLYFLSGAVRTMPEPNHPVAIALQEALAETLNLSGIKISEISKLEQTMIIDAALPAIRSELAGAIQDDHQFRDLLGSIFGTAHDWDAALLESNNFVADISRKTQAHREARKARGIRRFL